MDHRAKKCSCPVRVAAAHQRTRPRTTTGKRTNHPDAALGNDTNGNTAKKEHQCASFSVVHLLLSFLCVLTIVYAHSLQVLTFWLVCCFFVMSPVVWYLSDFAGGGKVMFIWHSFVFSYLFSHLTFWVPSLVFDKLTEGLAIWHFFIHSYLRVLRVVFSFYFSV